MKVFTGSALFLSLLLSFGTAQAEYVFKPMLEDVTSVSVSGYINIDYSEAGKPGVEVFGKLFGETLGKELDHSIADCAANKSLVESKSQPRPVLSDDLLKILNSLRDGKQFEDYKIVSSLMVKYAKNRSDLYFHQDYRDAHANCLVWSLRNDPQCNLWRNDFYMGENTPLMGSVNPASYRSEEGAGKGTACGRLVQDMLPRAYTPETRALYDRYASQSCQKLSKLKSCLNSVMQIDEHNRASGGSSSPVKGEANSTFDEFKTLDMIKR